MWEVVVVKMNNRQQKTGKRQRKGEGDKGWGRQEVVAVGMVGLPFIACLPGAFFPNTCTHPAFCPFTCPAPCPCRRGHYHTLSPCPCLAPFSCLPQPTYPVAPLPLPRTVLPLPAMPCLPTLPCLYACPACLPPFYTFSACPLDENESGLRTRHLPYMPYFLSTPYFALPAAFPPALYFTWFSNWDEKLYTHHALPTWNLLFLPTMPLPFTMLGK